jgi:hypothetical protein
MKMIRQISRRMGQSFGGWPGAFTVCTMTYHAVGHKERFTAASGCRVRPAVTAHVGIGGRGWLPLGVAMRMPLSTVITFLITMAALLFAVVIVFSIMTVL